MATSLRQRLKKIELIQALHFIACHFWGINYIKTLYLNFKWLPVRQALHFPIIVGRHVLLRDTSGKMEINGKAHFGQFCLSFYHTPVDYASNRSVVFNQGKIVIHGNVYLRSGVKLWVGDHGVLTFHGENAVGANSIIVCFKKVEFGYFSVLSWGCQVYDTNFHFFRDMETGTVTKRSSFVKIGDHVWVGNSVHITRGARLPKGCLVSNRSVVSRSYMKEGEHIMIAGHPAVKVLDNIEKVKGEHFLDLTAEAQLAAIYDSM